MANLFGGKGIMKLQKLRVRFQIWLKQCTKIKTKFSIKDKSPFDPKDVYNKFRVENKNR